MATHMPTNDSFALFRGRERERKKGERFGVLLLLFVGYRERERERQMEDSWFLWDSLLDSGSMMYGKSFVLVLLLVVSFLWYTADGWFWSKPPSSSSPSCPSSLSFASRRWKRVLGGNENVQESSGFWDEMEELPSFVVTDEAEQRKNREILDAYNRLGAHVTHFCFLVHGHRGFSKVRRWKACGCFSTKKIRLFAGNRDERGLIASVLSSLLMLLLMPPSTLTISLGLLLSLAHSCPVLLCRV